MPVCTMCTKTRFETEAKGNSELEKAYPKLNSLAVLNDLICIRGTSERFQRYLNKIILARQSKTASENIVSVGGFKGVPQQSPSLEYAQRFCRVSEEWVVISHESTLIRIKRKNNSFGL